MQGPVTLPRIITPLLALALAASCATHPPAAPEGGARQAVVAKVNGVALTEQELDETLARMRASRIAAPASSTEELRKRALDQMVIQELAAQEAAREGVRVDEKDLSAAMTRLKDSFGHAEGYEEFLKSHRLTEAELRSQVERRLLLERMYDREVRAKVAVSPEEVRKEYDQNKDRYVSPEKAAVTDFVFSQRQGAEAMLKKAGEVIAAVKESKDPRTVPADGIITVVDRDIDGVKEPLLFGAVRGLQEGEYTGLVETPELPHILKLVRIIPAKQLTFEEAKGPIEQRLRGIEEMKRFAAWQEELRKDAVIELSGDAAKPREGRTEAHP